ncbi:MAG: hypothetical protein FD153_1333 [Rhodospirillaceae bacterium]|nr:MAG: hypothetical protein FD153_1333 [Rhodospirillaceae bacterium]
MAQQVMMALGSFRFAVDTAAYQSMQHKHASRWESQDRITRLPAMHYLGPEGRAIDLYGIFYPHFAGGMRQMEDLRRLALGTEPLDLVDGTGKVWGLFVLLEVTEKQTEFLANGQPRRIECALKLQEYGEDNE